MLIPPNLPNLQTYILLSIMRQKYDLDTINI